MTARTHALELAVVAPRTTWLEPAAFLALAFGGSWALMLLGPSVPLLAAAMWVPGLAAILITRSTGGRVAARLRLDRMGWADAYLVAIWLPVVFAVGVVAIAAGFGLGRLDLTGDDLAGEIVGAVTLAPLVNVAVTLGPELGWRAYLLPLLLPLGTWRAIALTSVLWSLWQMPLAAGPAAAAFGPDGAVQLVWCLLIGMVLGWLYVSARSPWAPALFAAAIGATASLPALVLRDASPPVAGTVSPIGLILPALVVIAMRAVPARMREG